MHRRKQSTDHPTTRRAWVRRERHFTSQRKTVAYYTLMSLPFKGLTPLELALQKRNRFTLQMLLDLGAHTERRNAQGATILTTAIGYGYLECVKLLVDYGANVNASSDNGLTCLLFALEQKQHSIVAYLLEQNSCEVYICGTDGHFLLQHLILLDDAISISNLKHSEVDLNASCPVRSQALLTFSMVL